MEVETVEAEQAFEDDKSHSSDSQVTDDPALKDSTSGKSTADDSQESSQESSKFVKKETRHVLYLRVLVLAILFCASVAISLVVFFVTANGEKDSFESQYHAAADKVTGKGFRIVLGLSDCRVILPQLYAQRRFCANRHGKNAGCG